ncbi:hypothetical protein HDV01_003692, partial [Terramyces sp. JEL0728]
EEIFSAAFLLVPLGLLVPLLYVHQSRTKRPSLGICTFYLLILILSLIRIRYFVQVGISPLGLGFQITYAAVTLLLFLLENYSFKTNIEPVKGYESSEYSTTFIKTVFFWWTHDLIYRAHKRALVFKDLWNLPKRYESKVCFEVLETNWKKLEGVEKHRLVRALIASNSTMMILNQVQALITALLDLSSPLVIEFIINYVQQKGIDSNWNISSGLFVVFLYFVIAVSNSLVYGQNYHTNFMIQIKVKQSLQSMVYRKIMRISVGQSESGNILTVMNNDINTVTSMYMLVYMIIAIPIPLCFSLALLYFTIGWVSFVSIILVAASSPIIKYLGGNTKKFQTSLLKVKDRRIALLTNMLGGMKTIKLFGWGEFMHKKVNEIRLEEIGFLKNVRVVTWLNNVTSVVVPALSRFILFGILAATIEFDAATIFATLNIMTLIEAPISLVMNQYGNLKNVWASLDRIEKFMSKDEIEQYVVTGNSLESVAISFKDAVLATKDGQTELSLNLDIQRSTLNAIVGKVGSGKSLVLAAIIEELNLKSGSVAVNGSISYAAQQPWILNQSIKENILFGKPYDEKAFERVIVACDLWKDFGMFEKGEETIIGPKGVSLSGGQKARVSCARALYADADIVILDDPLSAVDVHVEKHLFDSWFNPFDGVLHGKTVVLVTHALQHVHKVDNVILMEELKVKESGKFEQLMRSGREFAEMMKEAQSSPIAETPIEKTIIEVRKKKEKVVVNGEKKSTGKVAGKVYWNFAKSCGLFFFFFYLLLLLLQNVVDNIILYFLVIPT